MREGPSSLVQPSRTAGAIPRRLRAHALGVTAASGYDLADGVAAIARIGVGGSGVPPAGDDRRGRGPAR